MQYDQPIMTHEPDRGSGVVTGLPMWLLRIEGLTVLVLTVTLYWRDADSWLLFLVVLLAPDVGLLGLLAGQRFGSATYNLTHTYGPPVVLGLVGVLADAESVVSIALVWAAHIGMDRAVGLGLQYPDRPGHTHLSIGRRRRSQADG